MIRTLFQTSWMHVQRMKYASLSVIGILMVLFLTLLFGVQMIGFLRTQRDSLIEKTTYPLFLQEQFPLSHERVQEFITGLELDVLRNKVSTVSKEQALDLQVAKDPSLLSLLSGDNPLPDTLMIPLYGTDVNLFSSRIESYHELFENPSSVDEIRTHLQEIQKTLDQMQTVTYLVSIFLALTAIVMVLLLYLTIRVHLRRFYDEYTIGRLVGADPYFFWVPHMLSMSSYLIISVACSATIFGSLQLFLAYILR